MLSLSHAGNNNLIPVFPGLASTSLFKDSPEVDLFPLSEYLKREFSSNNHSPQAYSEHKTKISIFFSPQANKFLIHCSDDQNVTEGINPNANIKPLLSFQLLLRAFTKSDGRRCIIIAPLIQGPPSPWIDEPLISYHWLGWALITLANLAVNVAPSVAIQKYLVPLEQNDSNSPTHLKTPNFVFHLSVAGTAPTQQARTIMKLVDDEGREKHSSLLSTSVKSLLASLAKAWGSNDKEFQERRRVLLVLALQGGGFKELNAGPVYLTLNKLPFSSFREVNQARVIDANPQLLEFIFFVKQISPVRSPPSFEDFNKHFEQLRSLQQELGLCSVLHADSHIQWTQICLEIGGINYLIYIPRLISITGLKKERNNLVLGFRGFHEPSLRINGYLGELQLDLNSGLETVRCYNTDLKKLPELESLLRWDQRQVELVLLYRSLEEKLLKALPKDSEDAQRLANTFWIIGGQGRLLNPHVS